MPKVTKKIARNDDLLQPVSGAPMDTSEPQPPTTDAAPSDGIPAPKFAPLSAFEQNGARVEFRRVRTLEDTPTLPCHTSFITQVPVPQHRMTPLKSHWMELYRPVTDMLKLDMRMNLKTRKVEIKTTKKTPDAAYLQKAADFVHAFLLGARVAADEQLSVALVATCKQQHPEGKPKSMTNNHVHAGFEVQDAIALLRLDDLYVECFEIKDVKVWPLITLLLKSVIAILGPP